MLTQLLILIHKRKDKDHLEEVEKIKRQLFMRKITNLASRLNQVIPLAKINKDFERWGMKWPIVLQPQANPTLPLRSPLSPLYFNVCQGAQVDCNVISIG
jgi:hypothetical protein